MRILMLDLDTLRPDHLGCYGYHRQTSPVLDGIAADGVRFTNYHCSDAPCLPSRAALMSGQFGIHTGVVGHGGTAADLRLLGAERGFNDRRFLPFVLRAAGLRTVSISPFAERHSAWWFNAGFTETYNTGRCGNESAEEITPTVLDWIARNGAAEDWFLHVNYWDPHTPYRAPAAFGNPFAEAPLPAWLTPEIIAAHRQLVGGHGIREISMYSNWSDPTHPRQPGEIVDMEDMRTFIDGYDCGIRYLDTHIGDLLQALDAQGVLDELAIIVTSDHGENLGELNLYAEHATADEITTHIPMILRWPGGNAGVDTGLHYSLDLAPTLAELCGQPAQAAWDGQSFASALRGESCGRPYLVLSQCAHTCQRGVRWDDWLYLRTYHDFYHLWPTEMLFNLADDPHEQHNLAPAAPERCREGAAYLLDWHDTMMRAMPDGYTTDPLWTVMAEGGPMHSRGHLSHYCEYLERTERADAIPALRAKYPGEFK